MAKFSFNYFRDQCNEFLKMMGLTCYTFDQRERAFRAINFVYVNIVGATDKQQSLALGWLLALTTDYERRMQYLIFKSDPPEKGVDDEN